MLKDYLITPSDIWSLSKKILPAISHASGRDWIGFFLLTVVAVGLFIFTSLSLDEIFLWLFTIWIFYWNRDARISIGIALAGLIIIPILLILDGQGFSIGEVWAEQVAVWVYFFLVIGVAKQIYDLVTSRESQGTSE